MIDPVPGAPAATATLDGERTLVVADVHAGIEVGLRYERGVELDSAAPERRERLLGLLDGADADRLVVVGDLAHRIGGPSSVEAEELRDLADAVVDRAALTLVPGNHDAGVAEALSDRPVDVHDPAGWRAGDVGFAHGHAWPAPEVLDVDVLVTGHEHPRVRVEDAVGGARTERAWLRGRLRRAPFAAHHGDDLRWPGEDPELVVVPAFNDRSGGTRVNVAGEEFLSPFLPDALAAGEVYLPDGTRLGDYERV
ncbi:MAG: metallophosphoesterase [Haloferacaceae archaeon]